MKISLFGVSILRGTVYTEIIHSSLFISVATSLFIIDALHGASIVYPILFEISTLLFSLWAYIMEERKKERCSCCGGLESERTH